ncbi:X-linked retinitis pigmentosa GTPase regulator-interacting protein 1 [Discoglossus pictus]
MSLLLVDETSSDLPVKDTDGKPGVIRAIQDVLVGSHSKRHQSQRAPRMKEKDLKIRRRVSLISREALEENFLHLHEENLLLKDHARKQEDKIKRMSTKLLRLTSELGQTGESKTSGSRRDGRDLEVEETIEDLQDRVRDLERRNEALRHRLTTYKQRLQVQDGCRHCPYRTVSARTDSGVRRNLALPDKIRRGLRVQGPETRPPHVVTEVYGDTLSDEARAEIDRLVHIIESQNHKMDDLERSSTLLKNMVTMKTKDVESDGVLSLHHMQQAEDQRNVIKENVMLIRLQKDLREKNTHLCVLREQFQQLKDSYETELQEKQKSLTVSHEAVLTQLEDLSSQLKAERAKVVAMEAQQPSVTNLQKSLSESQERVCDLEKEKELLKENYENLLKSSLDSDHLSSWKVTEKELRGQILQLEGRLSSHMSNQTQSTEQLKHEREQNELLKQEVSQLQNHLLEKIQEVHGLQTKVSDILLSAPTKEVLQEHKVTPTRTEAANIAEFKRWRELKEEDERWCEESRRDKGTTKRKLEDDEKRMEMDENRREEEELNRKEEENWQRQRKIHEMDAAHAETILELEKTREMLNLQHTINKDYQEELQTLRLRVESESREREESERNYEARLLQRTGKIQKLEAQLKDIAYGTFIPRVMTTDSPSHMEISPPPTLRRGETLFEVHIGGICFTPHGLRVTEDPQPTTFCIYSFYDFEMHSTAIVTGAQPRYDFTSRYAVTPDPDFLRYLRVGVLTVEMYQAAGGEHHELARGHLRLDGALQSTNKVHGTIMLTDACGQDMGEMDYWLRLHGPLAKTQQLQRQRSKACGYLSTQRQQHVQKSRDSSFTHGPQNELIIRIWGCRSLKVEGLGYQPSPYAIYRFYHHPDHSTLIIPCSNNPQFGDEFSYPLQLSIDLERYLQKECLYVYVFDDEDTQPGTYLGKAEVPLQRLADGSNIQGDFALMDPHGKCSGSAQLSLEWKFPYQAPGQYLWKSMTHRHLTPEKHQGTPICQHHIQGKLIPRDASQMHVTKLKTSKSRKAEEDPRGHVGSSKRGRRDPHPVTYQQGEFRHPRRENSTAGNQREESDMDVEEITTIQEVLQEEQEVYVLKKKIYKPETDASSQHSSEEEEMPNILERQISLEEVGDEVTDVSESQSTDSDHIIIVAEPQAPIKPPSSRIRVEVASLTFDPCSEVVGDRSVQRVFVEFRFHGVPLEETETPISLRKPSRGEEIYYHFSKVIHLDGDEHAERRQFLYTLLEGSDAAGEKIRLKFTVVSDPISEEDECQDVGYAYLDLGSLLKRAEERAEETLQIFDAPLQQEVIGALRVVVEAKDAARRVCKEWRKRITG